MILERSQELLSDLIMIGGKSLSRPSESWPDSTTHKLVYDANCSVLVAQPAEHIRPLSIILAIDSLPEAWQTVEFLCTLSLPNWAKITVVGVSEEKVHILAGSAPLNRPLLIGAPQFVRPARPSPAEAAVAEVIERFHDCGV